MIVLYAYLLPINKSNMWAWILSISAAALIFFYRREIATTAKFLSVLTKVYFQPQVSGAEFIEGDGNYAVIHYYRQGRKYSITVPYLRHLRSKMLNTQVFLVKDGGRSINITQQPGIPYLLTPAEMGGVGFLTQDEENGIKRYQAHQHIVF